MSITKLAGAVLAIGYSVTGSAAELQRETLQAWEQYIRGSDLQVREHAAGKRPFLWADDSPNRADHLRRGEVIVGPVVGHGNQTVPNGLIHHWIGAIFIQHATLTSLMNVATNFDRYKEIYRPLVVESSTIACSEQEQEYSMVWRHHVFMIDAAIQGHYKAQVHTIDPKRAYSITEANAIQEIQGYGETDQRILAPDTGSGFIWRIRSVSRYEERDGGVYLEIEALALTRDIPASMRWLVGPVINHLSINSLKTTLRQTRDAVRSSSGIRNPLCPTQPNFVDVTRSGSDNAATGFQGPR